MMIQNLPEIFFDFVTNCNFVTSARTCNTAKWCQLPQPQDPSEGKSVMKVNVIYRKLCLYWNGNNVFLHMSRILCDIVYLFKPLSASVKVGVSYVHVHKLTILRLKSEEKAKSIKCQGLAKTCQSCSYTSRPQSVVPLKKSFQNMESDGRALRKNMFLKSP